MATNAVKYPCPHCGAMRYGSPEQICAACILVQKFADIPPMGPWVEEALCSQTDPEVFFPRHYGGTDKSAQPAKAICAQCPVRRQCRDWAHEAMELWGVWGGETEIERRKALGIKGVRGAAA